MYGFRCMSYLIRFVYRMTAKYLQSQNPNAPSRHVQYGYTFVLRFTLLQCHVGRTAYRGVCNLSTDCHQTVPKMVLGEGATLQL